MAEESVGIAFHLSPCSDYKVVTVYKTLVQQESGGDWGNVRPPTVLPQQDRLARLGHAFLSTVTRVTRLQINFSWEGRQRMNHRLLKE